MANMQDLLGSLLRRGMTDSSAKRIEHSLSSEEGIGKAGGILEQELGIAPAKKPVAAGAREQAEPMDEADPMARLSELAKSFLGEDSGKKTAAAGGLGALLGSLLGGGSDAAKGAVGGGALALLGSIALQALRNAQAQATPSATKPAPLDAEAKLTAGLRTPDSPEEAKRVESLADLIVKAMLNAAKADGQIDEDEFQKVVGELKDDGISQAERDFLLQEIRKPMNTDEIVRAVTNRQVAAQVYAASLLAIEVDTPNEKAYLQKLARELQLDPRVVQQLHTTLGVAA